MQADIETNIGGIILKNPVMTASGTFGYGREFETFADLDRLVIETPCGMLNAIGLENVGLDAFITEKLPFLRKLRTPVFVNIYGNTIEQYAELAARLNDVQGIAGIEVNISCPNVKAGGIAFGTDAQAAYNVVKAVRESTELPTIVKLSPNVTDITVIAKSAEDAGADAISLINTITGMAVDLRTRRPHLANITGGLSGPAIKPVALRMVWQVVQAVNIPIIGIGGIMNADDALEFLVVGAAAVQIGTANFINPHIAINVIDGIMKYMQKNQIRKITEIIGTLEV